MIRVVGSINLDLIANVERLPQAGETVPGRSFATAAGGKGANQALAACRAGASVAMTGAVGRDNFAEPALELLRQGGVDLAGVRRSDATTGIALILVDANGQNQITVIAGANGEISATHVPAFTPDAIALLQLEIPVATVAATLDAARAAGARSVLNTAPALPETGDLLAKADFVIANEHEFAFYVEALGLNGNSRRAKMRHFAERTGRTIVVTLGSAGAVAVSPQGTFEAPALNITPVDTVGAGDTFCGYFAAGLDEGLGLQDCLRLAAVAGSLACLKPGAQPAIPMRSEVAAL